LRIFRSVAEYRLGGLHRHLRSRFSIVGGRASVVVHVRAAAGATQVAVAATAKKAASSCSAAAETVAAPNAAPPQKAPAAPAVIAAVKSGKVRIRARARVQRGCRLLNRAQALTQGS
jgi:hypothetical protein